MADEGKEGADGNKEGEKEERLFEPEVEGSLEKFEAELLHEEKRKTVKNLVAGFVIVVAISGGSYLLYLKYLKPQLILIAETRTEVAQKNLSELEDGAVKPKGEAVELKGKAVELPEAVAKPDARPAVKVKTKEATKPDARPVVKAGIKEEVLKEAPKASKAGIKTSSEKTAKAEKPPLVKAVKKEKAEKTAPPRQTDSRKAVSVKEKVASVKKEKTTSSRQPEILDEKLFTLQIGFFRERANAVRIKRKLEKLNLQPTIRNTTRRVKVTMVYAGEYPYREFASKGAADLLKQGFRSEVVIAGPGRYELRMGRFESEALADSLVKSLESLHLSVRVEAKIEKVRAAIVLIKDIRGKNNLQRMQELLKKEKIRFILVNR